ncbi:hypothetical protein MROS_2526 [Melioribacter roseus P3M-2]|jgi:hypothetical protein|uniref:Uncharacterized protein n=1 Tax=Melioribacter roseus (strain DSM 23840 / JCM 17771 / VKM B-2668 / P3M-2) TaxID=1191523 RepID=I7A793_MELRP|nr:hypothetical protein [Melioribacter roseus]AFN75756.1 hypothetical protein MROS_2526 [Melioribacter roseus P3M-2]
MTNYDLVIQQLKKFGYPTNEKVRIKPYTLYDEITIKNGTTQYNAFVNSELSVDKRNRVFPISQNEVVFINEIGVYLEESVWQTNYYDLFQQTYLLISIDDRVKAKIPFTEILTFNILNNQDEGAVTSNWDYVTQIKRKRKLQFPIIINSTSNVVVKVETTSSIATNFDTKILRVELTGVKFDKLTPFVFNPQGDKLIERLSFTMYDTVDFDATQGVTYDLFSTQNKDVRLFSKTFPLSDKETFSIENIEFFLAGTQAAAGSMLDHTILSALRGSYLKVTVDDTEMIEFGNGDLFTLYLYYANSYNKKSRYYSSYGLTLPYPVVIPSQSRVKASIYVPSLNSLITTGSKLTAMFKGTLQRV